MKSLNRALITGVNGQDGYFLAKFLIQKGYAVIGIGRSQESYNFSSENYSYFQCDITENVLLESVIRRTDPHEIYNLAAVSSIVASDSDPIKSYETNVLGLVNLLEVVRKFGPKRPKVFHASSSLVFGSDAQGSLNELTERKPSNLYAHTKYLSEQVCQHYRESHSLFISTGVPFNHEGGVRNRNSLFTKILREVIEVANETSNKIEVYNLGETRDLGYAQDFVEGFWKSLQYEAPEDFVFSTGMARTIQEIVESVLKILNLDSSCLILDSTTSGNFESTERRASNFGDSSKAKKLLGWEPRTDLTELIENTVRTLRMDGNFLDE